MGMGTDKWSEVCTWTIRQLWVCVCVCVYRLLTPHCGLDSAVGAANQPLPPERVARVCYSCGPSIRNEIF